MPLSGSVINLRQNAKPSLKATKLTRLKLCIAVRTFSVQSPKSTALRNRANPGDCYPDAGGRIQHFEARSSLVEVQATSREGLRLGGEHVWAVHAWSPAIRPTTSHGIRRTTSRLESLITIASSTTKSNDSATEIAAATHRSSNSLPAVVGAGANPV